MRAFAHLPSKRRLAGAIAFALLILSALGALHHHPLGGDAAPAPECFVCGTVVSTPEPPRLAPPQVIVGECFVAPTAIPVLSSAFRHSSPRAPPAA